VKVRLLAATPVPLAALATAAIVLTSLTGPDPAASQGAPRAEVPAPAASEQPARAATVTVGWVGDVTPGSQYGLPPGDGRSLFAAVREDLHEPSVMAGNLEGTLSTGGASKCGPAPSPVCFAFQAPPANAAGLADAGFDVLNLANNHAHDFGPDGLGQTRGALAAAGLPATGAPGEVTVVRAGSRRIAFVGFASYPWSAPMNDPPAVRELVRAADRQADHVVVLFHGGAEGSDRTRVPEGRELHLGEDRGDLRAFARQAIDAGADAVLGSGPHVLRGMEVHRDRLVAYSLGNFAGVHNFATAGTLGLSAVLTLRLDAQGRFAGGRLRPVRLDASGRPAPDPAGEAVALVRELSLADFGDRAPRIRPDGELRAPAQPR
jgi:hypothetical protein